MQGKFAVGKAAPSEQLIKGLNQLQDIWDRLVHVQWSRESFALLGYQARDLGQAARSQDRDEPAELAFQLQAQVEECLRSGQLPQGASRERLVVLLDGLSRSLAVRPQGPAPGEVVLLEAEPRPRPGAAAEVLVLDGSPDEDLLTKLRGAGFQPSRLTTLAEVRTAFARTQPAAVVVDVDFSGEPLAGIGIIAQLRVRYRLEMPVFFVAERGDITTRLEAVRAGGSGYFAKPVDAGALLQRLNDRLFHAAAEGYRVLIVDDKPDQAQFMVQVLEARGIVVHWLTQPLQVIQSLYRFQPDLLLLDLDLKEASGLELAQVIRQHQDFEGLPMLLLSFQADVNRHLTALGAGGDDLLGKPVNADYLYAAVAYRLHRSRVLHTKLQTLSQRDPVSGLYNRRQFLEQLERSGAGLGITNHSLAVMLIMLDNLRALRDDSDVACTDRLVEMAAQRLQGVLGRERQPARFADAFFAVLVENTDQEQLLAMARMVRQALEGDAYLIGERTLLLRTTIGVCLVTQPGEEVMSLIHHADSACSIARQAGGERIHVHNPHCDRQARETHRARLLRDIREAIEKERMGLVFQPIVSLRGDQAERYEVFLRMRDGEGQELLPESVFSVAQSHRLGVALDRWVIAHGISLLREHQATGRTTILFINISLATLQDESFSAWLERRLDTARMDPRTLVFEVSEEVAERYVKPLRRFVEAVRALGCSFSLERFGRRSDSIGLLRELAADYVKLDARFVQSLISNAGQQDQLRRLVAQLTSLQATTIVGGIENLYTLPVLWACGINYVQGYFLQRPHKEMSYDFTGNIV